MGIEITASADNNVFATASDIQLAIGNISQVAGIKPFTIEKPAGFLGIAKVTTGRRWAEELQSSLLSVRQFLASQIHNAYLVIGQGCTTRDKTQGIAIYFFNFSRNSVTSAHKGFPLNHVYEWTTINWREGQTHGIFSQSVDRHECLTPKTILTKTLTKVLYSFRDHLFGTVKSKTP